MAEKTASEIEMRDYRLDLRRFRAEALAHTIMAEIEDVIPTDFDRNEVFHRLLEVLRSNGACWTTDEDRAAFGLEPRDDLGWTPSERVAEKRRKLEAMQMLSAGIMFKSPDAT